MNISELETGINYRFKDKELLKTALVHSSAVNEYKHISNQRLEFLGDAVLQLVISGYLYGEMPDEGEGTLSKCRSLIVCTDSLYSAARKISLNEYLMLGRGEEHSGGRDKRNILADAFESLTGAIYLDGGLAPAEAFIMDKLKAIIKTAVDGSLRYDYKTMLQEYVQSQKLGRLSYELTRLEGPEHDQVFYSCASINSVKYGEGKGKSRKQSEQQAAKHVLETMNIISLDRSDK